MALEEEKLPDRHETMVCSECGAIEDAEYWDILGACDGNAMCPKCGTEVNMDSGEVGRCGKHTCPWCVAWKAGEV